MPIDIEISEDDSIITYSYIGSDLFILKFDGTKYQITQNVAGRFYDSDLTRDGKWLVGISNDGKIPIFKYNEESGLFDIFQTIYKENTNSCGVVITEDHQRIMFLTRNNETFIYKFNGT